MLGGEDGAGQTCKDCTKKGVGGVGKMWIEIKMDKRKGDMGTRGKEMKNEGWIRCVFSQTPVRI